MSNQKQMPVSLRDLSISKDFADFFHSPPLSLSLLAVSSAFKLWRMEWKGKLDKRTEAEDKESADKAAKARDRAGVSSRNLTIFSWLTQQKLLINRLHFYNPNHKYNFPARNISGPCKSIIKLYFTKSQNLLSISTFTKLCDILSNG